MTSSFKLAVPLAFALTLGCFALPGCTAGDGSLPGAIGSASDDGFKIAFAQENIAKEGVVSNDFTKATPYEVTAFEVNNLTESDGERVCDIKATIENESFSTVITAKGTEITPEGEDASATYSFDVLDTTTVPKKGIDLDNENELGEVESVLSEDGKTCTVEVVDDYNYWFVEGTNTALYTYEFGEDGWEFDEVDEKTAETFKDLEGTYTFPSGEDTHYSNFTITDLDPAKGSFKISFTQDEVKDNDLAETVYQAANVEETAGITPELTDGDTEGAMDNGILYRFNATGTTDIGAGAAHMNGYLGEDKAGNKIIYIEESEVSITRTWKFSSEPANETWRAKDYALIKD